LRIEPVEPMTALNELGIYRLAAVIHQLKKEGHIIESEMKTGLNKFGETCNWCEYSLKRVNKQTINDIWR